MIVFCTFVMRHDYMHTNPNLHSSYGSESLAQVRFCAGRNESPSEAQALTPWN